jgi:hypothetical protein
VPWIATDEPTGGGELVIIDPSTGVETFSADVPIPPPGDVGGPVQWSPDGSFIALNVGNSPTHSLVVDVETNTWTRISGGGSFWGWSPDGKWFIVGGDPPLLVPTVLLDTTDLVLDSDVFGVRPVPLRGNLFFAPATLSWMPDSSAVAIGVLEDDFTDVVTIADGQYRTLIEDGVAPSWSPDGRQLAYLRALDGSCADDSVPVEASDQVLAESRYYDEVPDEVWVAAADGTGAQAVATSLIAPIWSPDASLLLGAGPDGLFTVRPDGTGMTLLTPNLRPTGDPRCTPTDTTPDTASSSGLSSFRDPVWQPIPPPANADETTASATTDE